MCIRTNFHRVWTTNSNNNIRTYHRVDIKIKDHWIEYNDLFLRRGTKRIIFRHLSISVKPLEAGYAKPSVSSICRRGFANDFGLNDERLMSLEDLPVDAKTLWMLLRGFVTTEWAPIIKMQNFFILAIDIIWN